MITTERTTISISATINATVDRVWECWTNPMHIIHWNQASDDWFTPYAESDLHVNGRFLSRMEARDGTVGFDFNGVFTRIEQHQLIEYEIEDGRKVQIRFTPLEDGTLVSEKFEAEEMNPVEMQHAGWQAILDNFKRYVEESEKFELMHFEIEINAPVEKVYRTMIDENDYSAWTSAFNPTSQFRGSWDKGSKILFIGTDENNVIGGMVSRIRENIPNKFISIEHYGMIKDCEEITSGPEVEAWAGCLENYTFRDSGERTRLLIDVDTNHEFKSYFLDTWPKALNSLKDICENK